MHAFRKEGRNEPRILYWFRTPPYVKVGRTAIDEEAIRLLEERHPDVVFDWARILREPPQQMPPVEAEKRREAREFREARRRKRPRREDEQEQPQPAEEPSLAELADESEAVEPSAAEFEELAAESPSETSEIAEPHPLIGLVGPEGLVRLRARHASLTARIAEVQDDVRREALRLEAERLDPDMWVTEVEARQALETYEANYEALRTQLGRNRRRRRRRSRGQKPA
jgi:hypothetical protein